MNKSFPIFLILFLLSLVTVNAQTVQLAKDLLPGDDNGLLYADIVDSYGKSIVFETTESGEPNVLYASDGTEDGTREIYSLQGSGEVRNHIKVKETLFIVVKLSSEHYDLLKISEDSENPEVILSNWQYLNHLIFFDGKIYFNGEDPNSSGEFLYAIDMNTHELSEASTIHWLHSIKDMTIYDNSLFYISGLETDALGLYKYNSELSEPELVYDFKQINNYYENINMISTNDLLFFTYLDREGEYSLFSSDGTTDGTIVLDNTLSHISWYNSKKQKGIISYQNKIYMRTEFDDDDNTYLLVSDGTIDGTQKVEIKDDTSLDIYPSDLQVINEELYLNSSFGILKLNNQTGKVETVFGGSNFSYGIAELANYQDSLCFIEINSDNYNSEIWLSNGLSNGSKKLDLKINNKTLRTPKQITVAGDKIFFIASHTDYGRELFVYSDHISSTKPIFQQFYGLDVYPNPTADYISYDINKTIKNVAIYDVLGKKVYSKKNPTSNKIDIRSLNLGSYFIIVKTPSKQYKSCFIKE